MTFRPFLAIALAASTLTALPAFAADEATAPEHHGRPAPSAEDKAKWDAMTPDERKAKMEEMRAKREASMTPEEKAKHEARRKEWEAMMPEQRQAKMAEMRAKRGQGGGQRRQRQQ